MRRQEVSVYEIPSGECRYPRTKRCPRGRAELYTLARAAAEELAERHSLHLCTVDDVFLELVSAGRNPRDLGSSIPNIFRAAIWERMPWRVRRRRASGRRRLICVWRLAGEPPPTCVPERRRQGGARCGRPRRKGRR